MIAKTSIEAYAIVKETVQVNQSEKVFKAMVSLGGKATINQIKEIINLPPGRISARLSDLIKRNKVERTREVIKCKGYSNGIYKVII